MTISAEVVADSISCEGARITTLQLRYPRFIHAEALTHRVLYSTPERVIEEIVPDGLMYDRALSRNASSSRAIPVERMIEDVLRDTAMPLHWGKNQPGMQAREEHDSLVLCGRNITERDRTGPYVSPQQAWLYARDRAVEMARNFAAAGYHKQIVNRLLEPFAHINVVVTATEWDGFFLLRDHEDAMPEIRLLARAIRDAVDDSDPRWTLTGDWHIPYVREGEVSDRRTALKVSVARCARVSYLTHDGRESTVGEDIALYDRLVSANPPHASPLEHQARAEGFPKAYYRNFRGWCHLRAKLETGTIEL